MTANTSAGNLHPEPLQPVSVYAIIYMYTSTLIVTVCAIHAKWSIDTESIHRSQRTVSSSSVSI